MSWLSRLKSKFCKHSFTYSITLEILDLNSVAVSNAELMCGKCGARYDMSIRSKGPAEILN